MLEVGDLSFSYGSDKAALAEIGFSATPGQLTIILGPNGAGKTTLFRCILGVLRTHGSRILVDGQDISSLSVRQRARKISYVPQEWQSPFRFSVLEAVMMGFSPRMPLLATPGQGEENEALACITDLGIGHLAHRGIDEISGGERQLALLARSLVQKAPVILLDEPTSHLDLRNQMKVLETLATHVKKDGVTAVVTIHDPNLAAQFADHIVLLKQGRVYAAGEPFQVMRPEILEDLYQIPVEMTLLDNRPIIRAKRGKVA